MTQPTSQNEGRRRHRHLQFQPSPSQSQQDQTVYGGVCDYVCGQLDHQHSCKGLLCRWWFYSSSRDIHVSLGVLLFHVREVQICVDIYIVFQNYAKPYSLCMDFSTTGECVGSIRLQMGIDINLLDNANRWKAALYRANRQEFSFTLLLQYAGCVIVVCFQLLFHY